jgi:hypothetical protein
MCHIIICAELLPVHRCVPRVPPGVRLDLTLRSISTYQRPARLDPLLLLLRLL